MRGMHARGETGGVAGEIMEANDKTGTVYYRAMKSDIRDSNNNSVVSVVEATDTSVGMVILAETQEGKDEDGKPLPNASLALLRHLNVKIDEYESDLGTSANLNTKAIQILEGHIRHWGLEQHPNNVNGNVGKGLPWERLERIYTHPQLTKNVRKNQCCVEGVSQRAAKKLRKAAKKEKAKKAEEEEEVP